MTPHLTRRAGPLFPSLKGQVPRQTMLLLFAGAIAGACSRDAPLTGPEAEPDPMAVLPIADAVAARAPDGGRKDNGGSADPVEGVLTRLVPSLGPWGTPLQDALLRLQSQKKDKTAWTELQRAIEGVSTNLPDEYRPDLDALRLELGIAITQ